VAAESAPLPDKNGRPINKAVAAAVAAGHKPTAALHDHQVQATQHHPEAAPHRVIQPLQAAVPQEAALQEAVAAPQEVAVAVVAQGDDNIT
jgi:alpha-D-ribose 1-methylphosphonate 5-triphosphate synthase subunit PhnG